GEITVRRRRAVDSHEVRRRFQARKNSVGDFCSWHGFLPVAHSDIARPETHVFAIWTLRCAEENDGMSAFVLADIAVPENFHEIARLGICKIGEIASETKLVKQSSGPRAVRVPASPNSFTVALIADDQLVQRCKIELELAAVAQFFDGFDENQIR